MAPLQDGQPLCVPDDSERFHELGKNSGAFEKEGPGDHGDVEGKGFSLTRRISEDDTNSGMDAGSADSGRAFFCCGRKFRNLCAEWSRQVHLAVTPKELKVLLAKQT